MPKASTGFFFFGKFCLEKLIAIVLMLVDDKGDLFQTFVYGH
jgi:hypothetical protein